MSSNYLKNSFAFLLIYFLLNLNAFSQESVKPAFHKIDEEDGLSDNNIQCFYEDHRGFMWVGTRSGLNLIDGSTIAVFKNIQGDKNSISNNIINCITSDSIGRLWIGTQNGLNVFDPVLRNFALIPFQKENSMQDNNVTSIAVDKQNKVYIATYSGLFIYDLTNKKISFAEIPGNNEDKILNNKITHILIDKNGILYLSTYNGLWSYNANSNQFTHEISTKNDANYASLLTDFLIDHSGILWIGSWDKGLKRFDPQTKKVSTFNIKEHQFFNIRSLTEIKEPEGKYLILLNNQLTYFNPENEQFVKNSSASKEFEVSDLFATIDNWVWIGTNKGLYFYNPAKNIIRHQLFPSPITSQGISMAQWKKNILIGGSNSNFLKLYDENLNEQADFSRQIGNKQVSCLAIQLSGANMIKCGTSAGIADINLMTHGIHFHQLKDISTHPPSFSFITNLLKDSNQEWWIFPWRNGIWITDSATQNTRQAFNNFISEYNIPKPLVIADACEDKNKNIWFGDYDEGIILYTEKTHQFSKPFTKYMGIRNAITQIIYKKHFCYSFISNHLLIWNVDSMRLHEIYLPPVIDKAITSIALDSTDNIWMATQNGLIAYNLNNKRFSHFTRSDGLISNTMNGTLYCCKDGTIVYGCPDYLSAFNPEKLLKATNHIPHIELSEVMVNEKPISFDASAKQYYDHNSYNFIFKWAVTDFNNPLNNRYSYKLEGIDQNWRNAGKEGKVEFENLSPGSYTLLLKGENSNGVNADKILKLQFAILLPFWNTWWFFSLLFLMIVFLFYSMLKYRINQIKKIEKLRNKISRNLHDDIGSTLSSISILSDIALHRKQDAESNDMLKEIQENSISLMDRMDDIVWSINPGNDSLENLFLRIKTFAAKLFEAKEINYEINISDEIRHIRLEMEYRQHIYLIMKEAINNLVKYSNCTEANIDVNYHLSQLSIVLSDNGNGFDTNKISYGNGLNNMKKRAKEIKGHIQIVSKINDGTKITLLAKIK